jgi:hypothetical protein
LFTTDNPPHLIGGRGRSRASYFFPAALAGGDPGCAADDERDPVLLSRTGTVWSYTSMDYRPPPPYPQEDPYHPFILAAVQLEPENLVVLGQMVPGTTMGDMRIGLPVELVLDVLEANHTTDYLVWKWRIS